jgi:hypothetical protein
MTSTGNPERDGARLIATLLDGEPAAVRQATARALDAERALLDIASPRALAITGALQWIAEHIDD